MAASGLFPPVLDTYMPAFLKDAGYFKVNFDISDFNSAGDISTKVQVSVRDQYSNENLLKSPIEIAFVDYEIDTNTNQKYVKINQDDLIGSSFVIGKIYKIQLRFISSTAQNINQSITFINDNLDKFSEWSTVCLIKCISKPTLSVTLGNNKQDDKYVFQQDFSTIYGSLTFADSNDSETPKISATSVTPINIVLIFFTSLLFPLSIFVQFFFLQTTILFCLSQYSCANNI